MTQFDEAARGASFDVRTEYAPLLATHGVVISEASAKKITAIITKHFAEIEAVFGKLVQLVDLQHKKLILTAAYMTPESYAEMNSSRQGFDLNIKIGDIRRDPQVKAAIERSKG